MFFSTGRSLRTHSSQSSPSVAISIVSRIAWSTRSGENGSAGSGSVGRAGSIVFILCNERDRRNGSSVDCLNRPLAVQVNRPYLSPFRALPVRARARRFQQGSFGRLRSDECRRTNSTSDCLPRLQVNRVPTPRDFSPLNRQTFGQMRTRNRQPHNRGVAFLRLPRAHLDFSLSPCR